MSDFFIPASSSPASSVSEAITLHLSDFDYQLPQDLIAQHPLPQRSASRLLRVAGQELQDGHIGDLVDWLRPGDLLVMNDTRVLHARLYGHKATGGQIEVMVERVTADHEVLAQMRASKSPKPGTRLQLDGGLEVEVVERAGEFYRLRFPSDAPVVDLLERHGHLPLPPYIERSAAAQDEARYQTVFARHQGSVAAPTAGLHFDEALLAALAARGIHTAHVTLHVGAGTFQPVRTDDLSQHHMHRERYSLPAETVAAIEATRARGGRIVAVGTTTLRTLESAALSCAAHAVHAVHAASDAAGGGSTTASAALTPCEGETDLFILPGYRFRVVDVLLTNFHLPKSTLLMLVSAFAGVEPIRAAYRHAIAARYRFFSYGDAMLLSRQDLANLQ